MADVVSWEPPVAPMRRLIPQLAELCHLPLKLSPAMQDEVLCIAVHDIAPKDLMARVAAASGGKWVTEGDGTWLAPDAALRATLTRKGLETRTSRIQRDIDGPAWRQPVWYGPPSAFDSYKKAKDQSDPVKFKATGQELFSKLLHTVGAQAIAVVPAGGRIVYSTRPTQRQLDLGADLSAEATDYLRAHVSNAKKGPDSAYKLTFVVSCPWNAWPGARGIVILRFVIYNAEGLEVGSKKIVLDHGGIDGSVHFESRGNGEAFEVSDEGPPAKDDKPDDGIVKLSPAAASFFTFIRDSDREGNKAVQAESRKCLLHSDIVDPLAYPAEQLLGTAKARHLQLVASLPDQFFAWCYRSTPLKSPKDVLAAMEKDASLSVDNRAGWLTISCTDFTWEPVNRAELRRLSKKYLGKIDISMDDLLELGGAGFGQPRSCLTESWLLLACPVLSGIYDWDWPIVALLVELDPSMRSEFLSGRGCRFSDLSLGAKSVAEELVYGFWMQREFLELSPDPFANTPQGISTAVPLDFRLEPTEVAPSGVPAWGSITVRAERESAVRPAGRKAYSVRELGFMGGLTPEDLAERVHRVNHDDSGNITIDFTEDVSAFRSVQVGTRTTYRIRLYAGRNSYRECSLMVSSFPSTETYSLGALPRELRDEVNDAAVAYAAKDKGK